MSRVLEGLAPAKLNLGLRIRARRPDGYHELESVFVPLDLHDRIVVRLADGGGAPRVVLSLSGQCDGLPPGDDNLAVRAARAFLAEAGLSLAVEIELDKRIPTGAGLGGGSSDAGLVLRLLAGARPEAVAAPRLRALALSLGADVPYFLDPRPAYVTGVGERVQPVAGLPGLALLLLNPGVPLATAEIYRAFDALVPDPARKEPPPAGPFLELPGARLPGGAGALSLANDLEPVALRLCPGLSRLRRQLEALGPLASAMSGSGPTLFGVFPDVAAAERARARARLPAGVWARVAVSLESG